MALVEDRRTVLARQAVRFWGFSGSVPSVRMPLPLSVDLDMCSAKDRQAI